MNSIIVYPPNAYKGICKRCGEHKLIPFEYRGFCEVCFHLERIFPKINPPQSFEENLLDELIYPRSYEAYLHSQENSEKRIKLIIMLSKKIKKQKSQ